MTPAPCLEGVGVAGAYTPLTVGHGGTARLTILPDISFFILFYPLNGSRICRGNSLGLDVLKVLKEGRELILGTFGLVLRKGP